MIDADRWHEVFETLRRNKVRTFLTALGVFWGVFMLVIMLGFGRGLEKGVMGNLGRWATNAVHLWADGTEMPYKGHKRDRRIKFAPEDGDILQKRIPGVLAVITSAEGSFSISAKQRLTYNMTPSSDTTTAPSRISSTSTRNA